MFQENRANNIEHMRTETCPHLRRCTVKF